MTSAGFHDATTDELLIRAWWEKWPTANVGIATGQISGIVALDADSEAALATLRGFGLNFKTSTSGETFYETCQDLLKKSFTPPDTSSDERCWPGGSFHRKAYGLATSQR